MQSAATERRDVTWCHMMSRDRAHERNADYHNMTNWLCLEGNVWSLTACRCVWTHLTGDFTFFTSCLRCSTCSRWSSDWSSVALNILNQSEYVWGAWRLLLPKKSHPAETQRARDVRVRPLDAGRESSVSRFCWWQTWKRPQSRNWTQFRFTACCFYNKTDSVTGCILIFISNRSCECLDLSLSAVRPDGGSRWRHRVGRHSGVFCLLSSFSPKWDKINCHTTEM